MRAQLSADLGRLPFYLTQRLTRREAPEGKGFDSLFACQYMGSAEFEWGALPESLSRLRESRKRLAIHVGQVTRRNVSAPVFVVGDSKRIEFVPEALTAWMVDDYPHGKEMTYFPEVVEGAAQEWHRSTDAWWALRSDVMWTLKNDVAHDLLSAVRSSPEDQR